MVLATVAFAVASLIHFGDSIVLGPVTIADPFPGAAIPEAIIAIALGIGALSVIARLPGNWGIAFGTSLFALLLTVFGLTVTIRSSRTGDIVYHVTILIVLVAIVGLLLRSTGQRRWFNRGRCYDVWASVGILGRWPRLVLAGRATPGAVCY